MSQPHDFNAQRRVRATTERAFNLGPYTFMRRVSVPPETIADFRRTIVESGDDDHAHIVNAETLIKRATEDTATRDDGTEVPFDEAWHHLRFVGDEYGVIDISDLLELARWLIAGVAERPTGQPSGSPDGSTNPTPGTPSTDGSLSLEDASMISTPDGLSMRSTPA